MKMAVLAAIATAAFSLAAHAAAQSAAPTRAELLRAKLESRDRSYVFVTMHRGDWRHAPENSVGAGHTDERGHKGDADGSWGWCLARGATMIQTDRPVDLLKYLSEKGRSNLK